MQQRHPIKHYHIPNLHILLRDVVKLLRVNIADVSCVRYNNHFTNRALWSLWLRIRQQPVNLKRPPYDFLNFFSCHLLYIPRQTFRSNRNDNPSNIIFFCKIPKCKASAVTYVKILSLFPTPLNVVHILVKISLPVNYHFRVYHVFEPAIRAVKLYKRKANKTADVAIYAVKSHQTGSCDKNIRQFFKFALFAFCLAPLFYFAGNFCKLFLRCIVCSIKKLCADRDASCFMLICRKHGAITLSGYFG